MPTVWYYCAEDDKRHAESHTYYADRGHNDLLGCMDIRETRHPPEDAERVGGTCTAELTDGGVCGRDLPCPYHSD